VGKTILAEANFSHDGDAVLPLAIDAGAALELYGVAGASASRSAVIAVYLYTRE
jgi:hypothetical protein